MHHKHVVLHDLKLYVSVLNLTKKRLANIFPQQMEWIILWFRRISQTMSCVNDVQNFIFIVVSIKAVYTCVTNNSEGRFCNVLDHPPHQFVSGQHLVSTHGISSQKCSVAWAKMWAVKRSLKSFHPNILPYP